MIYRWEVNAGVKGNAQKVGEELARLSDEHGGELKPLIVLDAARDESSALHSCFEWRDDVAAEKFRLDQARTIIRSIRIVREASDGHQPTQIRAFVNLAQMSEDDQAAARSYISIGRVMSEPELFQQARRQFLAELKSCERRYKDFASLKSIIDAAARAAEEVELVTAEPASVSM